MEHGPFIDGLAIKNDDEHVKSYVCFHMPSHPNFWLAKSLIFRVPCFWPLTFTPICPDQIIRFFMEPPLCWQNAQRC
jgi:alkyl hydroperoxide reductase subunit AhpC